jgi:hypothetical protein
VHTEGGGGDTYTLGDLREQANNYMDGGNNCDEFDDLFDAMDEYFGGQQPGATAARASCCSLLVGLSSLVWQDLTLKFGGSVFVECIMPRTQANLRQLQRKRPQPS